MRFEQLIEIDDAAAAIKLLGDKTRLTMVKILDENECCVCEFVELFEMSQPAISQHLKKLKTIGLVNETRKGQWIFYSLNKTSNVYPLIKSLLEHIPNQRNKLEDLMKKGLRITCK
ncbi:ArsR/SmtB family transcription factor [Salirhabdus salicampi]|uniref:ArsR/SmtB family transcription factor n=1 Tax=Salirhabdus salicampi TaxID=476102 RepID=UPI0020C33D45|nr:metalloregulator ArsR/SmtB family transcription factor [Salirhabdus salicampi]MCP8615343.1 metalloregulator ArsR/SmtB family transcription factor [Salirhabdus salicampi]